MITEINELKILTEHVYVNVNASLTVTNVTRIKMLL